MSRNWAEWRDQNRKRVYEHLWHASAMPKNIAALIRRSIETLFCIHRISSVFVYLWLERREQTHQTYKKNAKQKWTVILVCIISHDKSLVWRISLTCAWASKKKKKLKNVCDELQFWEARRRDSWPKRRFAALGLKKIHQKLKRKKCVCVRMEVSLALNRFHLCE